VRIAIDIDSTLHHYWDLVAASAKRRFGVDLPYEDQVTWGVSRLRREQMRAVVADTHAEAAILDAVPYPGAVETVNAWADAGHFIHITSHRAEGCHAATERWLDAIGLRHDELYCSYDKIARAVEIGIDVLIDDSPLNLEAAIEHDIRAATIAHPWNRDVCEEEDVVCAPDWPALAKALEPVLSGSRAA
jgi:uncharacterized protein